MRGISLVLVAGAFWALSGTAAQVLFQHHGVEPQWLVSVRMLGAGLILYAWLRPPFPRAHWRWLLLFSVVGVTAVQYFYFAAIAYSNVATATFLQYTSIPMVVGYEIARRTVALTPARAVALVAALGGAMLLALGGGQGLALNPLGLLFGLISAVTAAFYILSAVRLINAIGPWPTTTWGFLVGCLPMLLWAPPWAVHSRGSLLAVILLTAFVIVFGTLISFGLFLASLRHLSPSDASIAATAEPVVAAAALAALGVALLPLQYAGGAAVIGAVVLLRRPG